MTYRWVERKKKTESVSFTPDSEKVFYATVSANCTRHKILLSFIKKQGIVICSKLHWLLTDACSPALFAYFYWVGSCVTNTRCGRKKMSLLSCTCRNNNSVKFFKSVKCWHWTRCLAVEGVLHRSFLRSTINICVPWIPACSASLEDAFFFIVDFCDGRPPEVGPLLCGAHGVKGHWYQFSLNRMWLLLTETLLL